MTVGLTRWMYDPWKDAGMRHPDIHIQRVSLAPLHGAWVPTERVILIDVDLSRAQTRHTLSHEVAHIDLEHEQCAGYGPGTDRIGRRCEREAEELAACRLVDISALADALRWTDQHQEVIEMMGITTEILTTRLACLTPLEHRILRNAAAYREEVA